MLCSCLIHVFIIQCFLDVTNALSERERGVLTLEYPSSEAILQSSCTGQLPLHSAVSMHQMSAYQKITAMVKTHSAQVLLVTQFIFLVVHSVIFIHSRLLLDRLSTPS